MADPRLKQITIKTGVLKRITKEKSAYQKEAVIEENRLEKFKAENKDEHVIRKQEEVIRECLMMIPECERRFVKAFDDLNELIKNEEQLKDTEAYQKALEILSQAENSKSSS